jgi:hypothetical protein
MTLRVRRARSCCQVGDGRGNCGESAALELEIGKQGSQIATVSYRVGGVPAGGYALRGLDEGDGARHVGHVRKSAPSGDWAYQSPGGIWLPCPHGPAREHLCDSGSPEATGLSSSVVSEPLDRREAA